MQTGAFPAKPTEMPRNNCFTNPRKTGILYHVLAPVAQLDRALDSDSKGHAFESHRAYQQKPSILTNRRLFHNFYHILYYSQKSFGVYLVFAYAKAMALPLDGSAIYHMVLMPDYLLSS